MSDTRQRVLNDIKLAMKAGEKERLSTLRQISAAIKQKEVDNREVPDEPSVIAILDKLMKQRRESISQYSDAGRDDLVAREQAEADLIETYLPAALSDTEIDEIINAAISESGASSVKEMGSVMGLIKPKLQGRADMAKVSQSIRKLLAG
ncbi:MAG: GatB/YqeY domain-containing protein [Granulosicoccus sp.]